MWDRVNKGLALLGWAVWIAAGVVALVYLPRISAPPTADATSAAFTRAEFITIVLTAVTVVLAALAIVLAVAAFFGYTHLKDVARDIAMRESKQVARETAETAAAREARAVVSAFVGASVETESITEALQDDEQHA